jgi:homoaconitate hydratase
MGSRSAKAYLASPEVVVASAVAGRFAGPEALAGEATEALPAPDSSFELIPAPPAEPEEVDILPGFPTEVTGRLVFVPADNLNTDGIYSKDYTYKEGMTPEEMAAVVMENYDPAFAEKTTEGDILVGGWNFGTGSSREQAATALKFKGIRMVLAGSFSQTYLRNAYNNGFVCIECPELVTRLKDDLKDEVTAGTPTILPGETLRVDFSKGTATYRDDVFPFPPLGSVPQGLVVAGGSENQVRKKLGLDQKK